MNKIVIGAVVLIVIVAGSIVLFSGEEKNVSDSNSGKSTEKSSEVKINDDGERVATFNGVEVEFPTSTIIAHVIDQFGEPIVRDYVLTDALGEEVADGNTAFSRGGMLSKTQVEGVLITKRLPLGTYTLSIPKPLYLGEQNKDYVNEHSPSWLCRCQPLKMEVGITEDGTNLGEIVLERMPQVRIEGIANAVGTPLRYYDYRYISVALEDPLYREASVASKNYRQHEDYFATNVEEFPPHFRRNEGSHFLGYRGLTMSSGISGLPAGSYTIEIVDNERKYLPKTVEFTVADEDVDLGVIVLNKAEE